MWTLFMDMHSGGRTKEPPYEYIFIEAGEDEAKVIFYNRFKHNPERVTCTCCGSDYSISSKEDLAQLTGYFRNCCWDAKSKGYVEKPDRKYDNEKEIIPLEDFIKEASVLVINANDISPQERVGRVPKQGYQWVDEDE